MAATKKKATRKKKNAAKNVPPSSLMHRTVQTMFQPKVLLCTAILGASVVLYPVAASLVPDLAAREEYRIATSAIEFPEPPRWIPRNLLDQVMQKSELPAQVSVLDRDLAEKIARAFEEHPWIVAPVEVHLSVPARIQVTFEYREPVAMIEVSDGFYPVDDEGILLPPRDFPPAEIDHYPRVTGMKTLPLAGVGSSWGDARVIGAARLAVVLMPFWNEWNFAAIEVPERRSAEQQYDDLDFVVTTNGGSRVIWGRPPGHDHPLELTDDQKIGKLKHYLADEKTFDGAWEISINHFRDIGRRSLKRSDNESSNTK